MKITLLEPWRLGPVLEQRLVTDHDPGSCSTAQVQVLVTEDVEWCWTGDIVSGGGEQCGQGMR